jgi:hypothetical protein
VTDIIVRNTDMCGIAEAQRVHCRAGVMQMDGEWYVDPGGCPAQMAKDELEPHMTTCAHVQVACRMGEHGCGWRGKRGEQPAHETACVYVQLEPFVLATKAEQDVTKAELAATKTELAAVKGACAAGGSIIALIWDVRDARKTELALDKLAELACDNCTATQALGAAGACEAVLMAMQGHTAVVAVQRAGCWALANLAHANPANKQAIAAAGGVEVVLTAMRTHAAESDVQDSGCRLLVNLALDSAVRATAVTGGAAAVVEAARARCPLHAEVQRLTQRLLSIF